MKYIQKIREKFPLILAIVGVISIIIRAVALFTAYDPNIGYFSESAVLTHLDRVFAIIGVAVCVAVTLATKNDLLPNPPMHQSIANAVTSFIMAFACGITALLLLLVSSTNPQPLNYVIAACQIGACGYYVYQGVRKNENSHKAPLLCVIFPIIAYIGIVLAENIDMMTPLNTPEKTILMITLAAATLMTVEGACATAGIASKKLYLLAASATAFLGAYSAIPGLIGNISGILDGSKYIIYYLIEFAVSIYAWGALINHSNISLIEIDTEEKNLKDNSEENV